MLTYKQTVVYKAMNGYILLSDIKIDSDHNYDRN